MFDRRQFNQSIAASFAATGLASQALAQEPSALEKIQKRGSLTVGIYNAMPPFHVKGAGIDADLATELAKELGLKLNLLAFNADENMADDLRNIVWRGHFLGFGPADVLLHVPVDKPLMDDQKRVLIFAPYFRETLSIARDVSKVPKLAQLSDLGKEKVAVPGRTLSGWLMIGADSGAYRDQLLTAFEDGVEAAQALKAGQVNVASGMTSELHAVLQGDKRYAVEPLPMPRAPKNGWAVGMAVKRESDDVARALQAAVNAISNDGRMQKIFEKHGVPWVKP